MNFFTCKCDKNQNQDEKTAMDLLDIKNLERSLKISERKIFKKENYIDINNVMKENINISDEELEIIEYPYSNKELNNKKPFFIKEKKIVNRNIQNLANLPKANIINRNKNLFNHNKPNINNKKFNSEDDESNSSLNNESLIIDDIEYLNDEDSIQLPKKKIKAKKKNPFKNNANKVDIFKLTNKRKNLKKNYNSFNNINNLSLGSFNKKTNDFYMKGCKLSPLNHMQKNNIDKKRKIYCLSQKKEDKKFLKIFSNSNNFNFIHKTNKKPNNEIHSANNRNKIIINKKNLNNEIFSKTDINNKEKKMCNLFDNKRINKRRINFKKLKLDLNDSKNNKANK